jgi:hypothetical protein
MTTFATLNVLAIVFGTVFSCGENGFTTMLLLIVGDDSDSKQLLLRRENTESSSASELSTNGEYAAPLSSETDAGLQAERTLFISVGSLMLFSDVCPGDNSTEMPFRTR